MATSNIYNPGGNTNDIQYNNSGRFTGDANLQFNPQTREVTVKGNVVSNGYVKGVIYTNPRNFFLTGGNSGEVLTTDGTGNLSWSSQSNVGNAAFANFLPNYTGNIGAGNVNVTGGVYTFDISATGYSSLTTLGVSANANINTLNISNRASLGNISNVKITGGTSGQVITTDGTGNLTFSTAYGNSNVLSYLNTISIPYANQANVANSANFVAAGNVLGLGNVYLTNFDGNAENVLYGNGSWAPVNVSNASGNSITNGSSNVAIPESNGNITIKANNSQIWTFRTTGSLTFPDGATTTGANITAATAGNLKLTTASLTSISAPCYIGLPTEYVADTEFNDDITAVQVGWTVIVNSTEYTVTYIDPAPPANQYRITVNGTAGFVSGTSYTFTNPVPVEHNWTIDQYGTMTAPGGGEISQINDDFKIEVTGTDVIDLRTAGGDLILDAEGNININGPINSSTGVARLDLTGGNVYLTSTDNDTTVLDMNTTRVQMYAGVDVSLTSGVLLPQLETDYTDSRTMLEESFTQNSGEPGYPWGITLPVSEITCNELILLAPDTFSNQAACTVQANNTRNTWELWQDTIAQSNVRITSNELTWTFDGEGNLTLPSNNSSINYANGTPYGGGGGSGYIIPYEVATFVANTQPGFGEITFCNLEGANSAPATAQKLFINESPTNEQSMGTIFQQWTSNSYRGTLSLNNGSDSQATFNISNGRIYFEPELYRGFQAGLNQIWGDDCSINQLIITNATAPNFYNTDFLVEDDVFHASGLATGNTHVMLNIYGSSQYNPINPNDLWNTFVAFVDNVLYDGETLRTNPDDIKTQFYNNTGSFRNNIPTQDLYQYFRFTSSSDADYFGTAPTTTNGSGTGATVRIRVNPNNTYTVLGTALPGVGYIGGETLTVLGTYLGGATPDNDLTILIDSVDGNGVITGVSYDSGTGVYPWPTNSISDGSDDQYDVGNYLNTNLATEISYANGITQTDSAAFGGGDYCVMYYQSFFCMVATGVSSSVTDLFYSGNLGFDGDGILNWTGLRSNQNVIANNNARYAYFDCEYLDGELTPTVGTTYNMVLDSAGINLDGFYAYTNPDSGDYYFGSNNDWRIESQNILNVQSYGDMFIHTRVNQRGISETGPSISITASAGSPGQREINATAGNGGTVNINGGSAGGSDGIDSLGNTGGDVNIEAGGGSGNGTGGTVYIRGGDAGDGTAGDIRLTTFNGPVGNGKVEIYTTNGTERKWAFNANGTTIFPTLTVDLHNGGNQAGQVLQFGDGTQQVIITGPTPEVDSNSQRLIIQGQRGNGQYSEGGDVYVWAGDADTYGGDIKIYAGDADNVSAGYGGYVNIEGGQGFNDGGYVRMTGGQSSNGAGATASVIGGYGNTVGGDANLQGGQGTVAGGNVNLTAGYGSGGPGGNVTIVAGGSANGLSDYGNINMTAGASSWVFGRDGNLTLPSNDFTVNYANGTQVTFGAAALGNVTFDDVTVQGVNQLNLSAGPDYTANLAYLQVRAGDVASHIHFDTGNNEAYDLIVGNDSKFVQVSSTGNIIMSSYDGNTSYTMKLDTTGNVTFPGVLGVAGGTATAVPVTNESGIPGGAGDSVITGTVASNPGIDTVQPGWTVTGNNLTATTTVTSVVESSPNFYTITTDTNEVNPFTYNDVYTFTSPGISNWVFANDNTLTFPRDEIANTDPYLRIEGGSNPRILVEDASLAGPSYLDITALNTTFNGSGNSTIKINPDAGEIVSSGNLQLWTQTGNILEQYSWTFDTDGNLTTPSNLVISASGIGTGTAIAQSDAPLIIASSEANGRATIGWYENPIGPGNVVQVGLNDSGTGSMTVLTGDFANTTYVWDFDNTGNLTLPTGGALNTTGNILSNGYARFSGTFDESQASTAGLYLGYAGGTPRMMFGTGNTLQTFEIDNDGGNLRFYQPGSTKATLTSTGNLSTAGSITATGKIGYANGGTVTQTGTGQGVTIHQLTGQITLAKSSWTAGDLEIFNVNCNKVGTYDYVMAQVINGTESTFFNVVAFPYVPLANSFQIQVRAMENTTSTPLIQFYIMKASIT